MKKTKKINKKNEEQDTSTIVKTRGGDTEIVNLSDKEARDLKKNPTITKIKTTKGRQIKEEIQFNDRERKDIADQVGRSLSKVLESLGDEVLNFNPEIEESGFTIEVLFSGNKKKTYDFLLLEDTLTLNEPELKIKLVDVGATPGEKILLNKEFLEDKLKRAFEQMYLQESLPAKDLTGKSLFIGDVISYGKTFYQIKENKESNKVYLQEVITSNIKTLNSSNPFFKNIIKNGLKIEKHLIKEQLDKYPKLNNKYLDAIPDEFQGGGMQFTGFGDEDDLDIGHEDNEPRMLKSYVYDIQKYASKLFNMLDKYEEMNREVDFPTWWQAKIIKARDYISSAQHYLEYEKLDDTLDTED